MPHRFYVLIISTWLGLVVAPMVRGANPPRDGVLSSPTRQEAGEGDLLSLDLHVYIAAKPIYCILVEKDRQRLRVLRHDGRLQVVAEYDAATGENAGPKEKEGDSKTPEGVYFISKAYLDRKVSIFGTRAFHLNYPNYFDLREGRAGYGIFIHGTNKDLRFNSSNGCVTLKNSDLDRLADYLTVGTPVFIVSSLVTLHDGKGEYPNLTEHNFDGAKSLLIPDVGGQSDFASLYLIRINGQTVLFGEYWPDQTTGPPKLTIAYLQGAVGNRWSVVDRGPAASGQQEESAVTIAGLPVEVARQRTERSEERGTWFLDESLPWQGGLEERYHLWSRESSQPGMASSVVLGQGLFSPVELSASKESTEGRDGKVYAVFFIATCVSIGSAFFLIRRQSRRPAAKGLRAAGVGEDALWVGDRGVGGVELLRGEVKQAMGTLHTVRKRIDEEAMNVESLEELQARLNALEWTFQDKQAEVDRLSAEQAALALSGRAERSGQTEILAGLQRELVEIKHGVDDARQGMEVAAEREGKVYAQLTELRRLAERELAPQNGEEIQEVVAVCTSLHGQVQAMAEVLQGCETSRRQELGELGLGAAEVAAALQAYAVELHGLHHEMAEIKGVADTSGLELALQGLRGDLRDEQAAKMELVSQLGRMSLVEEELAALNLSYQAMQQEREEHHVQEVADKMAWETTLEALRQELKGEQDEKADLASRLACFGELADELAALNRENEALRKRGEERRAGAETQKASLELALAGLRQELSVVQAEKSELTVRLLRIAELEEEQEARSQEIDALRQEGEKYLIDSEAEKMALESMIDSLQHELSGVQTEKIELSARLVELDSKLIDRDQAIESLRQEKEAHQAQAVAEKMALETELDSLQHELSGVQTEKSELSVRLAELDSELIARDQAIETLCQESEVHHAQAVAAKMVLATELDSLQHELSGVQTEKSELSVRLAELDSERIDRDQAIEALRQESEIHHAQAVAEKMALEAALDSLRQELNVKQIEQFELSARLAELDSERIGRDHAIESLRQESETHHAQAVAEKMALETELDSLRQELSGAQIEKSELSVRLAELDSERIDRDQAIEALRQEKETHHVQAEAEKMALETALDSLQHELSGEQTEKSELNVRLAELDSERIGRDLAIESLRQESETHQAQAVAEKMALETALDSLRQELNGMQVEQSELSARLAELDSERIDRDHAIEILRQESEAHQARAVTEKMAMESALDSLQHELSGVQTEKSELRARLARLAELEGEVSDRAQEIEAIRQEAETQLAQAMSEKMEQELLLESLRHELSEAQAVKLDLAQRLIRIRELEDDLARRNREIAVLKEGRGAEGAAEAEKRQLELVLDALRQELRDERAEKTALENRLQRIGGLEEELESRSRELKGLQEAREKGDIEAATEKTALESIIEALGYELSEGKAVRSDLEHRLQRIDELEVELAGRAQEIERLQEMNDERSCVAAADKTRLDLELDSLQNALRDEQVSNLELKSRLGKIGELEEELANRNREVEALRDDSEEWQVEGVLEKSQLESALAALRDELQGERSLRADLTNRLGRISELEGEVAARSAEIEALQLANQATAGEALTEKSRLEANLAEVVLARQVEVTSLTAALQGAKDKAFAEQEAVRSLTDQVMTLQEELRQAHEEQSPGQEGAIDELRQEVITLKAMVAALEKKALEEDGVVMVKGSHYLPGDVLRKWIGKE